MNTEKLNEIIQTKNDRLEREAVQTAEQHIEAIIRLNAAITKAQEEIKMSPLPWIIEDNRLAGGINHFAITAPNGGDEWMVCSVTPMAYKRPIDEANAQFIVTAVNSHAALVEACRCVLDQLENRFDYLVGIERQKAVSEAISKSVALSKVHAALAQSEPTSDVHHKEREQSEDQLTIHLDDWSPVEMKAQEHELATVETNKVPAPSQAQQLTFATTYCAELKARLSRLQGKALEAQMWLNAGQVDRATQAVNAIIIDV